MNVEPQPQVTIPLSHEGGEGTCSDIRSDLFRMRSWRRTIVDQSSGRTTIGITLE